MSKYAGLRIRLFAMMLLAIAPGIWIAIRTATEQRRREMAEAHDAAGQLANMVAVEEGRLLDATRQMLVVLSHHVLSWSNDPTACNSELQLLREHFHRYANLGMADLNGNVICSAV